MHFLSCGSSMIFLHPNLGMFFLFMARDVIGSFIDFPTHLTLATNARVSLYIRPDSMALPDVPAFLLFIFEFRLTVLFRAASVL